MLKRRHLMAGLAGTILAAPLVARAQGTYPSRSVKIIVPWPPGGGVDAFARVIQAPLSAQLGQTVIVENIGGSAGRVGTLNASRAQPDGYTIVLVNDTFAATEALPMAGTPALYPAFQPVTLAISGPQGLFTHPRSGLASAQAFAAAAKANPGKLNVGVPGLGSSQHLTSELLLRAAGDLRVTHVPYRGGGPLLQDLIAGNIDAGVVTFAAGAPQVRGGQLVALAITSEQRSKAFAAVPTAAETIAPGFVQATWQGLLAPKGTPAAAIERFHNAVLAVLQDRAVIARLADLGFDPVGADGKVFGRLFDETVDTFAGIARERDIAAGD
ncbi:MAG: tripartite tricarboxylate transporter substrate binding protein [Reyranella sp.]|uniref:Bug family tripartite tricarboxylate transporter substrate binding protein n=1 Tax=Reyranella sp. TaxID=1929291 RepID=UPI0012257D51|nr:tripartite tricarboxylate transporter substrate binding protein [Reyranella sp.]TAJ96279.1 MAG: tripartite tricarboxylate transporter substrate binding protein [Reyranella sp.]TBR29459.1 MAG: tripartite tricarboxylate transporter substrate binding protein [Reyranella sp.]